MFSKFAPTYQDWAPGLDNDELTLGEVRQTLPGNPPSDISPLVRLLENPCSPVALRGAVSLERHDCIHILIGRGLVTQDEAFVIGFTMGTAKSITGLELGFFRFAARWLYPKDYRFSRDDLKVFDLGVRAGRASGADRIYRAPLEACMGQRLGALRQKFGIDVAELRKVYQRERDLLPFSSASSRLPV